MPDDQQSANACSAEVPTKNESVKPSTSTEIKMTVVERDPGCLDPSKGKGHTIALTAKSDATGAEAVPILLDLAEGTTPAEEVKATRIIWPKDPVFLQREKDGLHGEFTVVNPTQEPIDVTPPELGDDCMPVVPSTSQATTVAPGDTAQIKFTVPACHEFDYRMMTVTASAETAGGSKADVSALVLSAEVNWGRLPWWFVVIFFVAAVLAVAAAKFAINRRNETAAAGSEVNFASPLIVEADAPKSWLTAVAGIGPLLVALASTTDLTEGLTGSDAIPQSTLIAGVSAFAIFLVGAAGLIGNVPLSRAKVGKDEQDCLPVWQFTLSSAIMATSAGITIWAFNTAVSRLDLTSSATVASLIFVLASVVLVLYLFWSVFHYVEVYAGPLPEDPKAPTPSAELIAAATQALTPYYLGNPPVEPCAGPPTYRCEPPDGDPVHPQAPTGVTFDDKVNDWIDGSLDAATRAAQRAADAAKTAKQVSTNAEQAKKAATLQANEERDPEAKEASMKSSEDADTAARDAALAAEAATATANAATRTPGATQVRPGYLRNLI